MSPRSSLAIARARLALLEAGTGERLSDRERVAAIADLEELIRELQVAAGETMHLPFRRDIDE